VQPEAHAWVHKRSSSAELIHANQPQQAPPQQAHLHSQARVQRQQVHQQLDKRERGTAQLSLVAAAAAKFADL
jgi:hypothetical protein